jgi:fructose/tagatose bisphosphate aldolase
MSIISIKADVLAIYEEAKNNKWVLPCFCTENLTTTEAILAATREYGEAIGINNLPIIIAITAQYDHRTQAAYYTHTRQWDIGLKLFLADLKVLTDQGSPYSDLRVMIHLDHVQFDDDQELLQWDMAPFSSIMFDASKVPFAENIALTRDFVLRQGSNIVIEGACDEIVDATGTVKSEMTTAENAKYYCQMTGVDLIVANLGTEHRASASNLQYRGDIAKKINAGIGARIVLHGASSVPGDQIAHLIDDGVCKVNLWTVLERDSSPALLSIMVKNAAKIAVSALVEQLKQNGYIGPSSSSEEKLSIDYFTTTYRQAVVFAEMKRIITSYLQLWYRVDEENIA